MLRSLGRGVVGYGILFLSPLLEDGCFRSNITDWNPSCLFQYEGCNPKVPRQMGVKQAGKGHNRLRDESRGLKMCMTADTNHIIKIYKVEIHRISSTVFAD